MTFRDRQAPATWCSRRSAGSGGSTPCPRTSRRRREIRGPQLGGDGLGRLPSGDPPLPAGPQAARARLVAFIRDGDADAYPERRDLMGEDATSHLSAYLRLGMCTPAQVGRALGLPGRISAGREAFWRQICWREFYHHHLARHPEVARVALRPDLRRIEWDDDPVHLAAWAAGETGYPIVDAGMRQLAQTAWIHNRARMVVASFLVKDLLVDWRRGESVFMQGLVDGDPANNNGGWQWTAGTGTDAAPYFRILSPVRQGQRFDPRRRLRAPLRPRAARRAGRAHPRAVADERRGAARRRVPYRTRLPGAAGGPPRAARARARSLSAIPGGGRLDAAPLSCGASPIHGSRTGVCIGAP